jgi:hypothetical protein
MVLNLTPAFVTPHLSIFGMLACPVVYGLHMKKATPF